MAVADYEALVAARRLGGPFDSVADCAKRTGWPGALERLARAMRLPVSDCRGDRLCGRCARWHRKAARRRCPCLPIADLTLPPEDEHAAELPALPPGMEVLEDYASLRLSLKAHPMAFLREDMHARNVRPLQALDTAGNGRRIGVAGLVICRQRPGSARGVVFLTLEDETGTGNIVVWPDRFEKYRRIVIGARLIHIEGRVQRSGAVVHLVAERFTDCTEQLVTLMAQKGMQTTRICPKYCARKNKQAAKRRAKWRGVDFNSCEKGLLGGFFSASSEADIFPPPMPPCTPFRQR